jgi:tetrahydromethanopterin S-methyltransferase subunit G
MASSPLEVRMAHLEGAYEQINARLGGIEARLGRLEDRVGSLESRVEERFSRLEARLDGKVGRLEERGDFTRTELLSRMDRQFYWILTLVVISILVPIFLRLLNA